MSTWVALRRHGPLRQPSIVNCRGTFKTPAATAVGTTASPTRWIRATPCDYLYKPTAAGWTPPRVATSTPDIEPNMPPKTPPQQPPVAPTGTPITTPSGLATGAPPEKNDPLRNAATTAHPPRSFKSKTTATWVAIVAGSLGLHRFYLHGGRDFFGWLHPLPTLMGLYGVARARTIGQDDQLAWVLIPLLGLTVSAAMLAAIVYGLTSDEKWDARFNSFHAESKSGWAAVFGAMVGLLIGASVLMATIAYASQRFFESQPASSPHAGAPTFTDPGTGSVAGVLLVASNGSLTASISTRLR